MRNKDAWVDFGICALLGWIGVHKFRERRFGMGILYLFTFGLFFIGWAIDIIRYLLAALHGERIPKKGDVPKKPVKQLLDEDPLPTVFGHNLILKGGERCHYSSNATLVKTKNVIVGYSGGNNGVSIRIAKGVSYRVGTSKAAPIRGNVEERTPGTLNITNQRVIFSAAKGAFDKKITALTSLNPYTNAIEFQFGSQQYMIETDEAEYIMQILVRIINTEA